MNRRVTIAPELVEPLQLYGQRFMLTNLTDIANHFIRHHLAGVPVRVAPALPTVPATVAHDSGNPLEDLSQLVGGL